MVTGPFHLFRADHRGHGRTAHRQGGRLLSGKQLGRADFGNLDGTKFSLGIGQLNLCIPNYGVIHLTAFRLVLEKRWNHCVGEESL